MTEYDLNREDDIKAIFLLIYEFLKGNTKYVLIPSQSRTGKTISVKFSFQNILSWEVVSIHPLENIVAAVELMEQHKIKKLVVTKNNEVEGILTFTDIARAVKVELKRMLGTWQTQQFGEIVKRDE
ncbi:MAG: CBS domain-containing protein [Candidatus Thermoplasmatota archaeon]|nr:CBS domain-containing protein [Candidatus Thermoplasmatota archaeon]MBU1941656.1 CBS domain-containing protein [Candidatus Thermoplasmatota archaeon]